MSTNTLYMPTKMIIGTGCVKKAGKELEKLGKTCLIVTGGHSAKESGALADAEEALRSVGIESVLFDKIGQNPKLTSCMEAAVLAAESKAEFIIGIGGGSPLDAAKCIAVLAANPGMTQEELYALNWENRPLPIVAIGTTAGTGSEVTKVSVITTPDGRKKSFHHEDIYPALSLGNPVYTMTMPEQVTRSTAIDVMAHCMESYFNRNAGEFSRFYAVRGIRLLLELYRKLGASGWGSMDIDDRECCYTASIYGGLAINVTGTAFPHTMGYLLTEKYSVPHGTACAVFLPDFYRYNKEVVPESVSHFLEEISCEEEEFLSLLEKMTPECSVEMSEEEVAEAHGRWIGNGSIAKCYGEFKAERADEILLRLFA